jgi:1,4-dihydroxy-6-naphthoate synthase
MTGMKFQLGYTPNADDAFMLFGLLHGDIATVDWHVQPVEANLQTLNDRASRGELEVTMISAACYALLKKRYRLLPCGASFGLEAGPVILAREPLDPDSLAEKIIAIPGATTTAYAMLQLYLPAPRTRILPLDKLIPAVEAGLVDCALVIHEEFASYHQYGLEVVVDLHEWWTDRSGGLPMPVTCLAVRNDLPDDRQKQIAHLLRRSIEFANENRPQAMQFAQQYSHGADEVNLGRFVRQYVNDLSLDMGEQGRAALKTFYQQAARAEILPPVLPLDVVDWD